MSLWKKLRFGNWSVRNKLIFSFLLINLLSILIISFLQYETLPPDVAQRQLRFSLIISCCTAIIIILISSFIKDSFYHTISKLMETVNQIKQGNFDVKVEIDTTEEFGILGDAFNQMISELKKSRDELEKTNKELQSSKDELEKTNRSLEKTYRELETTNINLQKTQEMAVYGLSKLAESRDPETGAHIQRMQYYAKLLAIELKNNEKYTETIDEKFINNIYISSALHDVGKVGVPDAVLLKPGRLEPEERAIIETHSTIGGDALQETEELLKQETGGQASFLTMGKEIAYFHHERWDGQGYPKKLKGQEIPLAARIVALADVYDALTSDRVYRKKMPHEKAKSIILEGRGTQFDEDVITAFLNVEDRFIAIREQFSDMDFEIHNKVEEEAGAK